MTETKSPWGIDNLQQEIKEATQKQIVALQNECAVYAQCFGTESGKKILDTIKKMIDGQPTWNPDMKPEYGYYREGQNDVLRHIINRVNYGRSNKNG